eukprot:SAG31_NODE_2861_length_4987_cov_105.905278_2_plen_99_part_00
MAQRYGSGCAPPTMVTRWVTNIKYSGTCTDASRGTCHGNQAEARARALTGIAATSVCKILLYPYVLGRFQLGVVPHVPGHMIFFNDISYNRSTKSADI